MNKKENISLGELYTMFTSHKIIENKNISENIDISEDSGDEIIINNSNIKGNISIISNRGLKTGKDLNIPHNLKVLKISDCNKLYRLEINRQNPLSKEYIDILLNDNNIDTFKIKHTNCINSISVEGGKIEYMFLESIHNNVERFFLNNCTIENLYIKNSDLGRIIFNGVTIETLTIENVTLNDCVFNGVKFPERLADIKDDKKMQDNYRQLKFVMDKNGNHTEANKFYAKEMEYYGKTLKSNSLEYFMHSFKGVISDFGNNWQKPLFWIFILLNIKILFYDLMQVDSIILYIFSFPNLFYFIYDLIISYFNQLTENFVFFHKIISGEYLSFLAVTYNLILAYLVTSFGIAIRRATRR